MSQSSTTLTGEERQLHLSRSDFKESQTWVISAKGWGAMMLQGVRQLQERPRCRRLTGVSQSTMDTGSGGELEPSA